MDVAFYKGGWLFASPGSSRGAGAVTGWVVECVMSMQAGGVTVVSGLDVTLPTIVVLSRMCGMG